MPPALTQIGPYRIVRLLGEGGMGRVFEAVHEVIERRVAIKLLSPDYARDPDATERLFNEARAVNRIEHPSMVQISDYGRTHGGDAYLVMEFLHGESLGTRMDRLHAAGKRLPLAQVLHISWQVADALAAAHEKRIVHRDLKPDNLMLVKDPVAPGGQRVKVLDFGIAKLAVAGGKKTDTNAVMGTPVYMSPEQCRGAGEVNDRTDVYSLGVMLYEMLAGRPPFEAEGAGELIGRHLFKEPQPLAERVPDVHPELARLIHRLLVKDKSLRPSMREAAREIERIQAAVSGTGPPLRNDAGLVPPELAQDSDQTRIFAARWVSTLGRSLGEITTKRRSWRFFLVLGTGLLAVGGLVTGLRFLSARPPLPAPLVKPSAPVGSIPAATQPASVNLANPISPAPAPKVEPPNPKPLPHKLAVPTAGHRDRTGSTKSSPTGAPPVRSVPRKRTAYED